MTNLPTNTKFLTLNTKGLLEKFLSANPTLIQAAYDSAKTMGIRCLNIKATPQAGIASGAATPIIFTDADLVDLDTWHNTGVNPEQFIVPAGFSGDYHVTCSFQFTGKATFTIIQLAMQVGGVPYRTKVITPPITVADITIDAEFDFPLVAGDVIRLVITQTDSGAAVADVIGGQISITKTK